MGGCYSGSYGYSSCSSDYEKRKIKSSFQSFLESGDIEQLVNAYTDFLADKNSGFIAEFAKVLGIKNINDIPKEFPEIEYEVKFDIQVNGNSRNDNEPEIVDYLNAFDFPVSKRTRFLKDPVNASAVGVNNFYGDSDEKLVVIEKGGAIYLKEKGPIIPLETSVKYGDIVIKRKEKRWKSDFEEASRKIVDICEDGVEYKGKVRKEKGDDFILDTSDGRIYSFTVTRAHLVVPNEKKESKVQRQLELEYAGYLPKFPGFEKDSEEQIIQGMVDLAKYTFILYENAPVVRGWRMNLASTWERKYDFIAGNIGGNGKKLEEKVELPKLLSRKPKNLERVK